MSQSRKTIRCHRIPDSHWIGTLCVDRFLPCLFAQQRSSSQSIETILDSQKKKNNFILSAIHCKTRMRNAKKQGICVLNSNKQKAIHQNSALRLNLFWGLGFRGF